MLHIRKALVTALAIVLSRILWMISMVLNSAGSFSLFRRLLSVSASSPPSFRNPESTQSWSEKKTKGIGAVYPRAEKTLGALSAHCDICVA